MVAASVAASQYESLHWPWRATEELPLMATASKSTLKIIVTESGNMESQKTVDGSCELDGRENKIIFIVPEGTAVKKDDVVVRFDPSEIDRNIAQQEIKVNQAKGAVDTKEQEVEVERNKGQAEISEAELELALAKLDLEKYERGEYRAEEAGLNGEIALAEADLEEAEDELEHFRTLVKKGFKSPEQLRYLERTVSKTRYYLERDKQKLEVLQKFDYRRKMTELTSKAELAVKKVERAKASAKALQSKAKSDHDAAKATLNLEQAQLDKYLAQKEKCVLKAKQDGLVAYANDYWYDSSRQIREGAMVYFRQKIFSLPDMTAMQVKVNVHESVVKKVKVGQKVEIRTEAFPALALEGTVKSVSPLADSTRSWARGGVKEYSTIVTVDKLPDVELKPGMTAEVKILVNELSDVIAVPVQAVTEHDHKHYVYLHDGQSFTRREVVVGETNEKLIEIKEGLDGGAQVALDARSRGIADFENDRTETEAVVAQSAKSEQTPGTQ